jgi:hypothetical protein
MTKAKPVVVLGGIISRRNKGLGFDIIFKSEEEARHYKEMFNIILRSDDYRVFVEDGYYDLHV